MCKLSSFLIADKLLSSIPDRFISVKKVLGALEDVPCEVTDRYEATLRRIQDSGPELASKARHAFIWIIYAFQQPTAKLFRYALASTDSGTGWEYTKGYKDNLQLALTACGGLIEEQQINSGPRKVGFFREYSNCMKV